MGDEDEGDAARLLQRLQLVLHLLAEFEIQRAERLVKQQHPRLVDQRAGERNALALAAGALPGPAVAEAVELDEVEHLLAFA